MNVAEGKYEKGKLQVRLFAWLWRFLVALFRRPQRFVAPLATEWRYSLNRGPTLLHVLRSTRDDFSTLPSSHGAVSQHSCSLAASTGPVRFLRVPRLTTQLLWLPAEKTLHPLFHRASDSCANMVVVTDRPYAISAAADAGSTASLPVRPPRAKIASQEQAVRKPCCLCIREVRIALDTL